MKLYIFGLSLSLTTSIDLLEDQQPFRANNWFKYSAFNYKRFMPSRGKTFKGNFLPSEWVSARKSFRFFSIMRGEDSQLHYRISENLYSSNCIGERKCEGFLTLYV